MELRRFKAMNEIHDAAGYFAALEAFDGIPQLQELKSPARERGRVETGGSVLDFGCPFARRVQDDRDRHAGSDFPKDLGAI